MKKNDVIKYLKRQAQKYYKNSDIVNYMYIKNCILVLLGLNK